MHFCLALARTIAILIELNTEEPQVNLCCFIAPLAIKCVTDDGNKVQFCVLFDSEFFTDSH